MMSEERFPPTPNEPEHSKDPGTQALWGIVSTLGGTMVSAAMGAEGLPPSERAALALRQQRRKAFFVNRYIEDQSLPADPQDARLLENMVAMNNAANTEAMQNALAATKNYLFSGRGYDQFTLQDHGTEVADAILNGAKDIDLTDLMVAVRVGMRYEFEAINGANEATISRVMTRHGDFEYAYISELVRRADLRSLVSGHGQGVTDIYCRLFSVAPEEMSDEERRKLDRLNTIIYDRIGLAQFIVGSGLQARPEEESVNSPYATPWARGERETLNANAADTIERLHLLRRYGVTPLEIPGDILQLPCNVVGEPPLAVRQDGSLVVAEGAVADFLFIQPDENHTGTGYHIEETDAGIKKITVGGARAALRIRLHDNGQLSTGFQYHNVPGDFTEKIFNEFGADAAFDRLRAVLIAVAYDALVPQEVVNSPEVGSAAKTMSRPHNKGFGPQISEMLLHRARSLQRAGVRPGHAMPDDWEGPKQGIDGYEKRLPQGYRARPTANEEACAYYRDVLGVKNYPGLPEGYTFVGPYDRRVNHEVTYRRARFRRNSATRNVLREL